MGAYSDFHRRSLEDREGFWAGEAKLVHWQKPFEKVLDYSRPPFARSPIQASEPALERLVALRDSFAPSQRELTLLFQAEFGRRRTSFRAEDVCAARVLFGQVVLMVGALLAADTETYLGAERLWVARARGDLLAKRRGRLRPEPEEAQLVRLSGR